MGRAVDAQAGRGAAPALPPPPAVEQVDELLSGEEVVLHVVHHAFDAWLVRGRGYPGRVDEEPSRLGVFHEGVVEARRGVLGHDDNGLHVVGVLCPVALCGPVLLDPVFTGLNGQACSVSGT